MKIPPASILRAALLLQQVCCSALIVHYHVFRKEASAFDSIWCAYIQLASSTILTIVLSRNIIKGNQTKVVISHFIMAFLGISVLLGICSSILFLLNYNEIELSCQELLLVDQNDDSKITYDCYFPTASVIRSAVFIVSEVICIHPTVSFLLYFWSARLVSASDPKIAG